MIDNVCRGQQFSVKSYIKYILGESDKYTFSDRIVSVWVISNKDMTGEVVALFSLLIQNI